MGVDRRTTQPIMRWWCGRDTCDDYRSCACSRWPAPAVVPPAASGWWDDDGAIACCWAAYQPKGAAAFLASLTDLSGNGNNAGDPGGAGTPTWDAVNGWKFDGIAQYLTTTFVPQNDQSQTMIAQYTTVTNTGIIAGMRDGVDGLFALRPDDGSNKAKYYNGSNRAVAPRLLAGNLCVAGNTGYRDGASDSLAIGAWACAALTPVIISGYNDVGIPTAPCAAYIQAFALYDCTLTAPQVLAVSTAMAAL